ncbi:hypothetical protein HY085_01260 [Candidatus Gottesmanbacteria bacterium]|nr:hypothetical protein [Candidatus Gottesmanbacteria bacterium]
MHHPDCHRTTVPVHNKPLFKGTFHKILKQSGLNYEQLKKLM